MEIKTTRRRIKKTSMKNKFIWFRKIALAEGISFIILLFIAMPLKYFGDMPKAVTIVGSFHGILFISFGLLALEVKSECKKDFKWVLKAGLASIIPFGTFIMDKYWKEEASLIE